MLCSSTRVMFFLLVCIGLLADNRYKVCASRNREFFLRETQGNKAGAIVKLMSINFQISHTPEDQGMLSKNRHILEEVNNVNKNDEDKAEKPREEQKTNDSFKSSKRRVRRGADPIHNKFQPLS
ncbi:unnamed protein product [Cochlearia groenlandica]